MWEDYYGFSSSSNKSSTYTSFVSYINSIGIINGSNYFIATSLT